MNEKIEFSIENGQNSIITESLAFLETKLKETKRPERQIQEALMLSEELIVSLIDAAHGQGNIRVSVRSDMWSVQIKLSAPGDEVKFDISEEKDSEIGIRNMLIDAYSDKVSCKYADGYNSIRLNVGIKAQKLAVQSVFSILTGAIAYLLIRYSLSETAYTAIVAKLFDPLTDTLIKMFNMVLLPVIFLSIIITCSKMASANRVTTGIGKDALASTATSSVIATFIGLWIFRLAIPILSKIPTLEGLAETMVTPDFSLLSTIFNLVPKNFIQPFIDENSLQVIFIAVILGLCIGLVGDKSNSLVTTTNALYEVVTKIVEAFGTIIPIGIFCATVSMCAEFGLMFLLYWVPVVVLMLVACIVVCLIYFIVIALRARMNPFKFAKMILPLARDIMRSGSSTEALPYTMRFCKSKLGISPQVYNVTLPFGAMFNLDGSCVYMAVAGLYIARVSGIIPYNGNVIAMLITIVIISMGAPNLSGNAIIGMITLLSSLGVPTKIIGAFICFDPLISLVTTFVNTIGDVVMTTTIAAKNNMLNKEIFKRN